MTTDQAVVVLGLRGVTDVAREAVAAIERAVRSGEVGPGDALQALGQVENAVAWARMACAARRGRRVEVSDG